MEGIVNFGPNLASFLLTSVSRRWYVVGAYMPPHDVPVVYCIEQASGVAPKVMEVIVLGDLNIRLGDRSTIGRMSSCQHWQAVEWAT